MKKHLKSTHLLAMILCSTLLFVSCSKDDDGMEDVNEDPDPVEEILPPIALDCDYFSEDRVLENDPQRPVDYIISCYASIEGSLKIEPGVVIAFENHAGMWVASENKLFDVRGTPTDPVIFTGTSQQNGFWRGLYFAEAHNLSNTIEHAVIEYAGSQPFTEMSPLYEGSLAIRGVSGTPPQALTLNHVEISKGGSFGLDFHRIETNATVMTSNLNITENNGVPAKVTVQMAHIFNNSSTYSGNASDFLNIVSDHYEIEDPRTWQNLDVPYLVDRRVHIRDGGHLTIEAGSELYFEPEAYLQPYDGSTDGGSDLSLQILGTADNPVLLTAANGTNWGGLFFGFTQQDNVISHAIIEYAKGDFPVGNIENSGAIYMHAAPVISVDNTLFRNIPNCVFYGYSGGDPFENLSTTNLTFENVGPELCEA
tara:strand:+ start:237277 stop:238548 length:1272 start_codon:yes stop_codon:yes gene_type:complete